MAILKIKEAIQIHNKDREPGEPKMTQRSLGAFVLKESTPDQIDFYMSMWSKDKHLTKLTPKHIIDICLKTGVSPNYLLGWEETDIS
jgi:hypothetical protein